MTEDRDAGIERIARHVQVSIVISSERLVLVWISCGMVVIWLFLGSVAFAEQVNLLAETSSQDEEALLSLASALLHDDRSLQDRFIGSVRAIVAVPFSLVVADPLVISALDPVLSSPTLRLHQRVSIYRI